jgi:DNA-binding beta-propeller fold protein YncE
MPRRLLLFFFLLSTVTAAGGEIVPMRSFSGGSAGAAPFAPRGIAPNVDGVLYAADEANDRVVAFDSTGSVISTIGFSGSGDGRFLRPTDVAAAEGLHLYVLDAGNERIELFDRFGQFREVLLSREAGTIGVPSAIEADPFGRLYVAEEETDRVRVFRSFTGEEEFSFGGYGSEPGRFRGVSDIAVDRTRAIYVADRGNNRIQIFDSLGGYLRAIEGTAAGIGPLSGPSAVAVDRFGRVYVADTGNRRIAVFDAGGTPIAEILALPGGGSLGQPRGVAVDDAGRLFVSDPEKGLVHLFRVGPDPDAR